MKHDDKAEDLKMIRAEMAHEQVTKHSAGGHDHHSKHFMKHSAGHQYEQDKVQKMCGGGYAKGK